MENPTRHKVREAEYFLSMMTQEFEDDNAFSYNLSAFLSAARSITWYMQKQYARRNGFAEWYCQNQIKMSADPELEYLNKVRVEDVHREPPVTGATREKDLTIDGIKIKKGTTKEGSSERGESKPPVESPSRTVRRFLPDFEGKDVVEFCRTQLTKLTKIAEECEKRFP